MRMRISFSLDRFLCMWRGHPDAMIVSGPNEVYLRCPTCWSRSSGWRIGESNAIDTLDIDRLSQFSEMLLGVGCAADRVRRDKRRREDERGRRNPLGFDRLL